MEEKKTNGLAASIIRLGLVLLAVSAIVALVLGLVNSVTAGRIAQRETDKLNAAMQAVLYADSYTDLGYAADDVNAVYQAGNAGWVVEVTETGSQGEITMIVGVSTDYSCTGISITSSSETAGLGAIAAQSSEKGEAFRAQFVGQTSPVAVTKAGGSIDAISGATITSAAVCKGVTAALDVCATLGAPTAPVVPAEVVLDQTAPTQPLATPPATQEPATQEPVATAQPATAEVAAIQTTVDAATQATATVTG